MSIPVSVVVVSRHRPDALFRCVLGLSQLQYETFEIVVVADAAGLNGLDRFDGQIKKILFEEANISAARNVGINHSAGEVIAFIDDDAVPEPTWLSFLTEPFAQPNVAAVGGFVRGRNGIGFQWKARILDEVGTTTSIEVDETKPTVLTPPKGHAVKTEGTNTAVRRDTLVKLSGFDPAYHFYLDETDLNMRIARAGYCTAISPLAQVHHGFHASARRRSDRVPQDLFDIGASWAVFAFKFIEESKRSGHWQAVIATERKRLISHMVQGGLEPNDVGRLLSRLKEGYLEGTSRQEGKALIAPRSTAPFLPIIFKKRQSRMIVVRPLRAKRIRADIAGFVHHEIVTLLVLSPTTLYHQIQFTTDGYWEQKGGLFGKSERTQGLFHFWTRKQRAAFEKERIVALRFPENSK